LAVRQAWPSALVIGVDRHDVLEQAIRLHVVDVGADDPAIVGGADLVVLSVSAVDPEHWLARLPDLVPGDVVVTSLDGATRPLEEAASRLPGRCRYLAGHACIDAGPAPIGAARPDLFAGCPWVFVAGDADAALVDRFSRLVGAVGARPLVLAPGAESLAHAAGRVDERARRPGGAS
jgi:prephenate dehydrogenase